MIAVRVPLGEDSRFERAVQWFIRLREADVSTDEIAEWSRWYNEPDNSNTYQEVQALWSLIGDAGIDKWPPLQDVRNDAYEGSSTVLQWNSRGRSPTVRQPHRLRRNKGALGIAASVALAVGLWAFQQHWLMFFDTQVYTTGRGVTRQLQLEDGSFITLGGASRVRVEFADHHRSVELQAGEAFFKVKPDKSRPFVVHSRDINVTAVGTAFTVREDDIRTVVSVSEGSVEVLAPLRLQDLQPPSSLRSVARPHNLSRATTLRTRAGEQMTYDARIGSSIVRKSDAALIPGLQGSEFTYVDEPLHSVITRLNRYTSREIMINQAIGELRYTGTVIPDEVDDWVSGLERVFPVHAIALPDGRLLIEPL